MVEVWKFPLEPFVRTIEMPAGADLLHVAVQGEQPCVWALVDPDAPRVDRRLRIHGTGQVIGEGEYVGTFHLPGPLVLHVFDDGEGAVGSARTAER